MASDYTMVGGISVDSTWHKEKKTKTASTQAAGVGTLETEAQTVVSAFTTNETVDASHGVDPRDNVPPARPAGGGWVYAGEHFDDDALCRFLESATEGLQDELLANTKSSAFDHYNPSWKERSDNVRQLAAYTPSFALEGEWHAIGISWNSNGTLIAVTYGRIDTVAWCRQRGYACVWQVGDADGAPPHLVLEASSYITAIAFHPRQPSLLAGGTYNGEVMLWRIGDDDPKPVVSGEKLGPKEPVMRLQWLQNPREARDSHRYVLCSASGDGRVLFWTPTNKLEEALSAYEVHNKRRNIVGVQSMSFVSGGAPAPGRVPVPGVENGMLLGMESGDVYRTKPGASVAGAAAQASGLSVLEVEHFKGHLGPVHSIDCSPYFRHLFLTCSSDGAVRLYSTLEARSHLMALEPSNETRHYLYAAQFSPCRPAVLATVSRSGHMHVFDLTQNRTSPVLSMEAGTDGAPAITLQFCRTDPTLVATGDAKGTIRIWRMAARLSEITDSERAAVRSTEGRATDESASALRNIFGVVF